MIKKISLSVLALILMTSCVSSKVYEDLEAKYTDLKKENKTLKDENNELLAAKNKAENDLKSLQKQYDEAASSRDKLASELAALQNTYDNLKSSYDALEENSSSAIEANLKKNRELLAQLEAKNWSLSLLPKMLL